MRFVDVVRAGVVATIASATAPAVAAECYLIVDRTNQVIYQGLSSPVDLSDAGTAARDALRARGEQLIAMDTSQCPPIDRARITGNGKPASVEEIVAGMRPALPYGRTNTTPATASDEPGAIILPRITVPVDTGGPASVGGPVSGMSIR
jgi:hypothetical protein